MSRLKISMQDMSYEIMLIIEHSSGVFYETQVGGTTCAQVEIEGVLAPVELEPQDVERVMNLPYQAGRGITPEIAQAIDGVLASAPGARYLKVDRARLDDSWEAWIFVIVDSPEGVEPQYMDPYFGAPVGFGTRKGVLTWPNSD